MPGDSQVAERVAINFWLNFGVRPIVFILQILRKLPAPRPATHDPGQNARMIKISSACDSHQVLRPAVGLFLITKSNVMKKLLVPCDFSQQALNAFQFALDIAAKSPNSSVHLLHVVELPVLHDSVLMPVLSFEQDLMEELNHSKIIFISSVHIKDNYKPLAQFAKI